MRYQRLTQQLGYEFSDASLLRQALTHRSFGTPHNERLEFLGDSVLNCSVARLLFEHFPRLTEGELSRIRASLVRQQALAEIAGQLQLGEYLMLGEGELKSGGFRRPSILADAVEAILGAIMLDRGFDAAFAVIAHLYHPMLSALDPNAVSKDPKTRLQEWLQGRRYQLPMYTLLQVQGEAHDQQFEVECQIPELKLAAKGLGSSRRTAEQDSAQQVYEMIMKQQRRKP